MAGEWTEIPRNALAPYPWSCNASKCLAEGYWNGDQRRPVGHETHEGFTYLFRSDSILFSSCQQNVLQCVVMLRFWQSVTKFLLMFASWRSSQRRWESTRPFWQVTLYCMLHCSVHWYLLVLVLRSSPQGFFNEMLLMGYVSWPMSQSPGRVAIGFQILASLISHTHPISKRPPEKI